jgi:hypothetical protein
MQLVSPLLEHLRLLQLPLIPELGLLRETIPPENRQLLHKLVGCLVVLAAGIRIRSLHRINRLEVFVDKRLEVHRLHKLPLGLQLLGTSSHWGGQGSMSRPNETSDEREEGASQRGHF